MMSNVNREPLPKAESSLNKEIEQETTLLYLKDSKQLESTAMVVSCNENAEGGLDLILDRTVFYPKGGGQPDDRGTIKVDGAAFLVTEVRLLPSGSVVHTLAAEPVSGASLQPPKVGVEVLLEVDRDRRSMNARCHSAGHLIDLAVQRSEFKREPIKANHSPDECWVQFKGSALPEGTTPEQAKEMIQAQLDKLSEQGLPIVAQQLSPEQAQQRGVTAPPGKSARVVFFEGHEGYARGCGGTHVEDSSQLSSVFINGIRFRKGKMSITYSCV